MGFFFSVLTSSLLALFLYVCDWTFADVSWTVSCKIVKESYHYCFVSGIWKSK